MNRGPRLCLLLPLLLLAGGLCLAPARVEAQPQPESSRLSGVLLLKNSSFFEAAPNDRQSFWNEGILQVEWAQRFAPWLSTRLVGEARADTESYANQFTFQIPETSERRSYLSVKESVVRLDGGPVAATLGKQFFAWGTADGYNPTDNLNPYDYMDPVNGEKMGVWSAAAQLTVGATNATVAVIPVFSPSRVPLTSRRWVPPLPTGIIVNGRELPGQDFANVEYAARIRTTFRGWDVSVSYFDGFESTPVIKQSVATLAPGVSVPVFTPVFTQMQVAGLDASTTLGKFEIHAEAAAKFAVKNGPRDRFEIVGGFNYAFDDLGLRWLERINVILEYAREVTLATHPAFGNTTASVQNFVLLPNNGYNNAVIGRVLLRFTDDTQAAVSGTVDLSQSANYFTRIALTHRLTQRIQIDTGVDVLGGPSNTFWGRWGDNDRFFFLMKLFF